VGVNRASPIARRTRETEFNYSQKQTGGSGQYALSSGAQGRFPRFAGPL